MLQQSILNAELNWHPFSEKDKKAKTKFIMHKQRSIIHVQKHVRTLHFSMVKSVFKKAFDKSDFNVKLTYKNNPKTPYNSPQTKRRSFFFPFELHKNSPLSK
jgi:hypothetical protein